MNDEQKREHVSFLYRQLDICGQIIAETEPGPERTRYNREYRGIVNALRRFEPEKWKDYPLFRKYTTEMRNEMVRKFLSSHPCPKRGGEFRQTRGGSFHIVCQQCGQKSIVETQQLIIKEYSNERNDDCYADGYSSIV